jgi:hypothetical protein
MRAFSLAPAGSIVIELNGDDWLADRRVLRFLNKVYANDHVWITYNTAKYPNHRPKILLRSVSKLVIKSNAYRNSLWCFGQPRTFRREMLDYLRKDIWIDPSTNDYWASAQDQAYYLAMLELAGRHSKHMYRISYVYNHRAESDDQVDPYRSFDCARRIRLQTMYEPLDQDVLR